MSDRNLVYVLDGRFTKLGPIGLVTDGIRMDNEFAGRIRGGLLDGASLTGVDYFRIRTDGVGVVTAREMVERGEDRVAVTVTGYVLPPAGMQMPTPEALLDPDFSWPDEPFRIEAFATFETAAPDLAELNRMAVVHTGTANMASGELTVYAHRLNQPSLSDVLMGYQTAGVA